MNDLKQQINTLKKEKNAIILAHYYTLPEVQDYFPLTFSST